MAVGLCTRCVQSIHSCRPSQKAEKPERISPPNSQTMEPKHLKWPQPQDWGWVIPSWGFCFVLGPWDSWAQLWGEGWEEKRFWVGTIGASTNWHQVSRGRWAPWALCVSLIHQPIAALITAPSELVLSYLLESGRVGPTPGSSELPITGDVQAEALQPLGWSVIEQFPASGEECFLLWKEHQITGPTA